MSKRFIVVPPPAVIVDPSGKDTDVEISWEDAMRAFFRDVKWHQAMDYEDRARVRQAFISAKEGDVIELEDDQWKVAAEIAKRPGGLGPDFLDSPGGVAMLDAIRNAKNKHPNDTQPKGPKTAKA